MPSIFTFQPAVVIKIKEIQVSYRVILVLIQFLEEGLNKSCNMLLPFNCSTGAFRNNMNLFSKARSFFYLHKAHGMQHLLHYQVLRILCVRK